MKTATQAIDTRPKRTRTRKAEDGATLIIIATALVVILAAAALSIDLGALYLERSEAQRAADAGALAGAQVFATSGCALDASCLSAAVQATATARATDVAQKNLVMGQTPTVPTPTFVAGGGSSTDPLITVTVQAPAQTFFLPLASGTQISATATAEAYIPAPGSGPTFCASCLKPFFVPNCDPNHASPVNSNCPAGTGLNGGTPAAFFSAGNIANPASIVGETWQLHFQGSGGTGVVPSQWLEVAFNAVPSNCAGGQSATAWAQSVTQCAPNVITCGTQLCTLNGNKIGPNDQAVCSMITYGGQGTGCSPSGGQAVDSVSCGATACSYTAGSGNPFAPSGSAIQQSSALISVPVYDGTPNSGGGVVSVVGYMQVFIECIQHGGSNVCPSIPGTKGASTGSNDDVITAVIVSATSCGSGSGSATGPGCNTTGGGSGTSGTVSGGGGNLIPVRLVHQ